MRYYDVILETVLDINEDARVKLTSLLETKHLYQRVKLDIDSIIKAHSTSFASPEERRRYTTEMKEKLHKNGFTASPKEPIAILELKDDESLRRLKLHAGNAELFCPQCDGRKVFIPHVFLEVFPTPNFATIGAAQPEKSMQHFCITHQCGVCQAQVTFLIRREKDWLTVAGRSPMESLETPSYIPKKEREFYSNAVIAMNAGKHLAALFYLRTFIEQFARRITGKQAERETGDQIMDAYADTLPMPQRGQMPSLKEWYGKLSEALHAANADDALFSAAREEIERHFDIRRVFKIPE